jgi:hypothetical protein
LKSPYQKLAEVLNGPEVASILNKTAHPVFVAGIKYPSLFDADLDSGIRAVSIWKGMKKSGGGPVQIRKALVVMESWVTIRAAKIREGYSPYEC